MGIIKKKKKRSQKLTSKLNFLSDPTITLRLTFYKWYSHASWELSGFLDFRFSEAVLLRLESGPPGDLLRCGFWLRPGMGPESLCFRGPRHFCCCWSVAHTLNGKAVQVSFSVGDLADTTIVDTVMLSTACQSRISFTSCPCLWHPWVIFVLSFPSLMLPAPPTQ